MIRSKRAGATKTLFRNLGLNFFILTIITLLQLISLMYFPFPIYSAIGFFILFILATKEYIKMETDGPIKLHL